MSNKPNDCDHLLATPPHKPSRELQVEQDDLVIFGEDGKFYLIQKSLYATQTHELPSPLMGAAEFVVGLGSVVSDLSTYEWASSRNLLAPCSCVVLNLAAIRQVSEKREKEKEKTITLRKARDGKQAALCKSASREVRPEVKPFDPNLRLGTDDLVIFDEDWKFYWIKPHEYQSESNELPPDMRSAPALMVKLGTIVADIPRIPTAGTYCVLLNLAAVRKGSSHAALMLEESIQISHLPEAERPAAEGIQDKRKQDFETFDTKMKMKARSQLEKWAASALDFMQAQQNCRLPPLYDAIIRQREFARTQHQEVLQELIELVEPEAAKDPNLAKLHKALLAELAKSQASKEPPPKSGGPSALASVEFPKGRITTTATARRRQTKSSKSSGTPRGKKTSSRKKKGPPGGTK